MESYSIKNLTFAYPSSVSNALEDIQLDIEKGEFITICGMSGSGKTTLLRQLKPDIAPHGNIQGEILFEGIPINQLSHRERSSKIGYIMQNPEAQAVTDKVWHEIAFGLESLGLSNNEITSRVGETAAFFGMQSILYQNVSELSGGQKQLLNLASVMAMQPSVLILDEPSSRLDPIAAASFASELSRINKELGTTIIITEHNLENVFSISDRIIILDKGRIISNTSPKMTGEFLRNNKNTLLYSLPVPVQIYSQTDSTSECPTTIREGRNWLEKQNTDTNKVPQRNPEASKIPIVNMKEVFFRYKKDDTDIIKGLSQTIYKGEIFAITGSNGAGKSTLLSLLGKVRTPYRGKIKCEGRTSLLTQDPRLLFTKNTIYDSIKDVAKNDSDITYIAELCDIVDILQKHPYDISGGEQQRAGLAMVLSSMPDILLLDEPTKGIDAFSKKKLGTLLQSIAKSGITIIMVSHDTEFCAEYATRCSMLFDGKLVGTDSPQKFFSRNSFYTTAANRMAKTTLPTAVTANDILCALGKEKTEIPPKEYIAQKKEPASTTATPVVKQKNKPSKKTVLATFMVLFLMPITILTGIYAFGDRKYNIISLLIIAEITIPFIADFEGKSKKTKELVIISVLCALGIAGRVAFAAIPEVKPIMAVVIISGIAFGSETGFIVGAISAFVSNMYFGQGAWTPWQMFAFGFVGMLSSIAFEKRFLKRNRITICIYGFIASLLVYGIIMNTGSVLMWQPKPSAGMLISSLITGIPFDLVHSISTAIFLLVAGIPILEKLDRVKNKYGI